MAYGANIVGVTSYMTHGSQEKKKHHTVLPWHHHLTTLLVKMANSVNYYNITAIS